MTHAEIEKQRRVTDAVIAAELQHVASALPPSEQQGHCERSRLATGSAISEALRWAEGDDHNAGERSVSAMRALAAEVRRLHSACASARAIAAEKARECLRLTEVATPWLDAAAEEIADRAWDQKESGHYTMTTEEALKILRRHAGLSSPNH